MSSAARHYLVTGPLHAAMLAVAHRSLQAGKDLNKFRKKIGAKDVGISRNMGATAAFTFEQPPDKTFWKRGRNIDFYTIKQSNSPPALKSLRDELTEIEKRIATGHEYSTLIGMKTIIESDGNGLVWRTVGVWFSDDEKDIVVSAPAKYQPPASLADQLTRISDIEFEKMQNEKKERAKCKTSKKLATSKSAATSKTVKLPAKAAAPKRKART